MKSDDLFCANANIIRDISCGIAHFCPEALVAIITNPVNICVPIAAEVLRACGVFNPRKLFGVSTLATVRARTFIGQQLNINPRDIELPIIGGHSKNTCVPILSKCNVKIPVEMYEGLVNRIRNYGGDEIIAAKNGNGLTTLAMAWAGARFINCLCTALVQTDSNPQVTSYIRCDVSDAKYFCSPITLCRHGVKEILCVPNMIDFEKCLLSKAIPKLKEQIAKGEDFIRRIENGETTGDCDGGPGNAEKQCASAAKQMTPPPPPPPYQYKK